MNINIVLSAPVRITYLGTCIVPELGACYISEHVYRTRAWCVLHIWARVSYQSVVRVTYLGTCRIPELCAGYISARVSRTWAWCVLRRLQRILTRIARQTPPNSKKKARNSARWNWSRWREAFGATSIRAWRTCSFAWLKSWTKMWRTFSFAWRKTYILNIT